MGTQLPRTERNTVRLYFFRHISTSGLGVGASRASFIAFLALQVTVRHMLRDLSPPCPVCNVGVLWPNGWMIRMPLGMEVGLGPGDIMRPHRP